MRAWQPSPIRWMLWAVRTSWTHIATLLVSALLLLPPRAAGAQGTDACPKLSERNPRLLHAAAQSDLELADLLDTMARACADETDASSCGAALAACSRWLEEDSKRPHQHNESFLRGQMSQPFAEQQFPLAGDLPAEAPHPELSCSLPETWSAAAAERRAGADRHRRVTGEYERFARWAGAIHARCAGTPATAVAVQEAPPPAPPPPPAKVAVVQVIPASGPSPESELRARAEAESRARAEAERREAEAQRAAALARAEADRSGRDAREAEARAREESERREREIKAAAAAAAAERLARERQAAEAQERSRQHALSLEREVEKAEARAERERKEREQQAQKAEGRAKDEKKAHEREREQAQARAEKEREQLQREHQKAEARAEKEQAELEREREEAEARAKQESQARAREREKAEARAREESAKHERAVKAAAALAASERAAHEKAQRKLEEEQQAREEEKKKAQAREKKLAEERAEAERKKKAQATLAAEVQAAREAARREHEQARQAELARRAEFEKEARARAEQTVAERRKDRASLARVRAEEIERFETARAKLTKKKGAADPALAELAKDHQTRLAKLEQQDKALVERERADQETARKRVAAEEAHRRKMDKLLAAPPPFRHPRARSGGALSLGLGLGVAGGPSQTLGGVNLAARHAFWFEPPAEGLASGFEVLVAARGLDDRAAAPLFGAAAERSFVQLGADLRFWKSRVGVGAALDHRRLSAAASREVGGLSLRAGPSVAFAAVDSYTTRVVLTGRWLPLLGEGLRAGSADVELGWKLLYASLQAGFVPRPGAPAAVDSLLGAAAGARLAW
jgi:hypothetical protein